MNEHSKLATTIWLTGIPSSGKTTLALALAKQLGKPVQVLDGDVLRQTPLSEDLGFSYQDRRDQCRRVGWLASLLNRQGISCIVALVSPYESHRLEALSYMPRSFIVYVKCPIAEAQRRDVKGLYRRQKTGKLKDLTGVDAPYEAPRTPDVVVNTFKEDVDSCVQAILSVVSNEEKTA